MTFRAILNCYDPESGANIAQIGLGTNGEVQIHGDRVLARQCVEQLFDDRIKLQLAVNRPLGEGRARVGRGRPRKPRPHDHVIIEPE